LLLLACGMVFEYAEGKLIINETIWRLVELKIAWGIRIYWTCEALMLHVMHGCLSGWLCGHLLLSLGWPSNQERKLSLSVSFN
jgi:hypothetical protein